MARSNFLVAAGMLMLALSSQLGMSSASAQVFHDDFNSTSLDPAHWVVAGGGTITVAGGTATLSAGCGEQFPYVTTLNNPFARDGRLPDSSRLPISGSSGRR